MYVFILISERGLCLGFLWIPKKTPPIFSSMRTSNHTLQGGIFNIKIPEIISKILSSKLVNIHTTYITNSLMTFLSKNRIMMSSTKTPLFLALFATIRIACGRIRTQI